MRPRLILAALLFAVLATPAGAQSARSGSSWATPAAPVEAPPMSAPRAASLSGAGLQSTLRPQTSFRGFTSGAFSGLAVAGDQAPVCRSRCANDRYVCEAANDGVCDERWLQCATACAPPLSR
jgi:hypothetical protein